MKINANFRLFAASNFDATKYIASPAYGVNRFMLDRVGEEKARATTIVEYKPNSKFPEHTHIGGEEFLVLEGTFKDQFGEFAAGVSWDGEFMASCRLSLFVLVVVCLHIAQTNNLGLFSQPYF